MVMENFPLTWDKDPICDANFLIEPNVLYYIFLFYLCFIRSFEYRDCARFISINSDPSVYLLYNICSKNVGWMDGWKDGWIGG